ncbi:phage tail tape measure protein [Roseovarius sp.]|uniref:phage tail tape measure protein n=1 Tax=Roseovarius sp. TaxID=1486281 RepID=UPI003BAADD1F
MATETSRLIVELMDRVTEPARRVARSLAGIKRATTEANRVPLSFSERLDSAMARNSQALAGARAGLFDAAAGIYAIKAAISGPVSEAANLQQAMLDVSKVVDFTPEGLEKFKRDLAIMSRTVSMTQSELAAIAAAAGQSGIPQDEIIEFTEAAAKIGLAFDVSAEEAGRGLAKMRTGLGMSTEEVVVLSDAMNHLSNVQGATAAEIMDVMLRVGATAKTYGLAAKDTAAFASAMIAAGAETNVAATSLRNMGRALTKGEAATSRQRSAFKELGLEATDVAKRMQEDATGTIVDVLERLQQVPKEAQAAVASNLFGDEARALGPLLTNLDLVRESLGLVAQQSDYAGSAFEEWLRVSGGFWSNLDRFKNAIKEVTGALGTALIPRLEELMAAIKPILYSIAEFVSNNQRLAATIFTVTSAVIGFRVALAGLRYLGLLGRSGLLAMIAAGFRAIGATAVPLGRAVGQSVGLQRSLAAMAGQRLGFLGTIRAGLSGIAGVTGLTAVANGVRAITAALAAGLGKVAAVTGLTAVARGLRSLIHATGLIKVPKAIGALARGLGSVAGVAARLTGLKLVASGISAVVAAVGAISAPLWVPIAAAIAAVGAAWKYWDRITAIVSGVASAIGDQLGPVMDGIKEKLDFLEPVIRPVGEAFSFLAEKVGAAWRAVKDFLSGDLFKREKLGEEEFASIEARAKAVATAIIETIKGAFRDFFEWVRGIPDRIIEAIGTIDLSGVIRWPQVPEELKYWWRRLFGGETPEPVTVTREEFAADAAKAGQTEQQRAEAVIAGAGSLTSAAELAEMGAEAEGLRDKIAAINREIRNTPRGRGGERKIAQLEAELGPLKARLVEVEGKIGDASRKAGELQTALEIVGSADVTPNVNDAAIQRALSKAERLERALSRINSGSAAAGASTEGTPAPRARGGPISRGARYLVGERGPELITAARSAYVVPNRITERIRSVGERVSGAASGGLLGRARAAIQPAISGREATLAPIKAITAPAARGTGPIHQAGPYGPPAVPTVSAAPSPNGRTATAPSATRSMTLNATFNFSGVSSADAGEIERGVRRALREEVREMFRGVYSDTGMGFS